MPCKVCRSPDLEPAPIPAAATAGFDLRQCRQCGFVFLTGADISLHGRTDQAGHHPHSRLRSILGRIRYRGLLRWLTRLSPSPPDGLRILDAGCGLGDLSLELRRRGWDVWACDAADDAAEACAPVLGDRFVGAPFESVALPEKSFDVVLLNFSLEHMDEPRSAAEQAARLLKSGGVVAIRVPNFDAALAGETGSAFQLQLPHHRLFFGSKSLRLLLEQAGFGHVEISTPPSVLEAISGACDRFPSLDPDRWIHRPSSLNAVLKGSALAVLLPYFLIQTRPRCGDGRGVILYASARKER